MIAAPLGEVVPVDIDEVASVKSEEDQLSNDEEQEPLQLAQAQAERAAKQERLARMRVSLRRVPAGLNFDSLALSRPNWLLLSVKSKNLQTILLD